MVPFSRGCAVFDRLSVWLVVLVAFLPLACSETEGEDSVVEGAGARVTIPDGALDGDVDIAIEEVDAGSVAEPTEGLELASGVFAFTPHGTQFNSLVTISLPYDSVVHPEPSALAVFRLAADDGSEWESAGTAEFADGFAEFGTDRFSYYAVMEGEALGDDDDSAAGDDDDSAAATCDSPLFSDNLDAVIGTEPGPFLPSLPAGSDIDLAYAYGANASNTAWVWCESHEGDQHNLAVVADGKITLLRDDHAVANVGSGPGSGTPAVNVCSPVIDASACTETTLAFQHSLFLESGATTQLVVIEPGACCSGWSGWDSPFDASQVVSSFTVGTGSSGLEDYTADLSGYVPASGQFRIAWQLAVPDTATTAYPTWAFDNIGVTGSD